VATLGKNPVIWIEVLNHLLTEKPLALARGGVINLSYYWSTTENYPIEIDRKIHFPRICERDFITRITFLLNKE